ncbi:hypothetical protein [Persephonella sp. KM09-Lau-8]|uniref:hypothetical protein n=1 Tax=Persephonella sp. KM09-Lau-8 TaxID=1158345 RepID=UPI00068CDB08|nr:hypothetical protein [Persephonella sp. KM09-Lau-8]
MNIEIIQKRFNQYLNEEEKHLQILREDIKALQQFYPFTAQTIEKILSKREYLRILDQLTYRFMKFQDTLAKLIRYYLLLKGENVENMSVIDIVNLAEKLGISINEELWFEMRALRNSLTHEYAQDYQQIAEALNHLVDFVEIFEKILNEVRQ